MPFCCLDCTSFLQKLICTYDFVFAVHILNQDPFDKTCTLKVCPVNDETLPLRIYLKYIEYFNLSAVDKHINT